MIDLIRREDVIEAIFSKPAWHGSDGSWYHSDDIRDAIGSTPSADRPQGKWIYCKNDEGEDGYRCSECGFFVPWHYDYVLSAIDNRIKELSTDPQFIQKYSESSYCPYCGRWLKGVDDE